MNGEWVGKSVRIRKDQDERLEKRHINFSELVRDLLDRYLDEENVRRDDETDQKAVAAVSA